MNKQHDERHTAKLTYSLVASTGYEVDGEAHGISPEHWGRILSAINKPDHIHAMLAAEAAQPLAPSYDVLGELDRIIDELENGFVACERCGDQEDTATLDTMPHLRVLRDAIAQPAAVPDGWKLVPVEPTIAMQQAGDDARLTIDDITRSRSVYRAMLAAAPKPEGM